MREGVFEKGWGGGTLCRKVRKMNETSTRHKSGNFTIIITAPPPQKTTTTKTTNKPKTTTTTTTNLLKRYNATSLHALLRV